MKKNQLSGVIFVFLSAVIFGFTPVLAAISYQGGNNGINMAFLRAFLPIPVLLLIPDRLCDSRGRTPPAGIWGRRFPKR